MYNSKKKLDFNCQKIIKKYFSPPMHDVTLDEDPDPALHTSWPQLVNEMHKTIAELDYCKYHFHDSKHKEYDNKYSIS